MAEDVQLKLQYSCSTTESGVVWGAISDWASPILAYLLFIAAEAVPGICGLVAALSSTCSAIPVQCQEARLFSTQLATDEV